MSFITSKLLTICIFP